MPYAPDLSGCALDGRYELHAVIGEGAFGRVYRGYDRRLERTVAVKLIKPWWSEDPEWARSFQREAQLLARVSHPGIVQIFDVGQAEEGLYYVSELVDGQSLADRLREGPVQLQDALAMAEHLCRALERAHARHVVHRDVKPANILLSSDDQLKVGDFGVARLAEGSSDGAGATVVGTPRYMAPEQARGRAVTPATDVYSAGVVLYEMLAGRPPFTDGTAVELALRHLRDAPPPLPPGVPTAVARVVETALAKNPGDRYPSGGAMADALLAAQGEAVKSTRPSRRTALTLPDSPTLPPATRRAPQLHPRRNINPAARRRSLAALSAAFLILGAMIAGALVLGGGGRVRVPDLIGRTRGQVRDRARALALQPRFRSGYSARVASGHVISQRPRPGRSVAQGSVVHVLVSAGPPPVPVPNLASEPSAQAQARLAAVGLRAAIHTIVAPQVPAGVVYSQSPAPGTRLHRGRVVSLEVAETPQWRSVASMTGSARATSLTFHIRGDHWRIVYAMHYVGTCSLIFICSGSSAEVDNLATGTTLSSFDLNDGGRQAQTFSSGPGTYRVQITPGSDTTQWTAWVEDYY